MIYSRQRETVLETLRAMGSHPTADELYASLRESESAISLATVYRNLGQLAANGLILRIPNPGGPDRFDATVAPHFHALCERCGRAYDIFPDDMPDLCALANRQNGIDVTGYSLLFTGVCNNCKAKEN